MTWKSTAAVSGLGLLATWLASTPPPSGRAGTGPSPSVAERSAVSGTDIAREADRLAYRLRHDAAFDPPSRNLFRFEAPPAVHRAPAPVVVNPPVVEDLKPPPAALRVTLSGIATDHVDGQDQRTAVLSTPAGILMVHEGDVVAGQYRVGSIQDEAVELVRLDDGGTLRLSLR